MSYVLMLTADKPLPLCDKSAVRTKAVTVEGEAYTISLSCGFSVNEHSYYRHCTDALGYPFKPCQYELSLYNDEADLQNLKSYLLEHFQPGERVDLWHVCVSDVEGKTCPPRRSGTLEEFNPDTLGILLETEEYGEECWLSIMI